MEKSESGAPIYRHEEIERDFELAVGDSENIDKISSHIELYVGEVATVFHELISDLVHIDIHIVNPTKERNFYTLVTSGMSDLAMTAPADYADRKYSELMICLPPTWNMSEDSWKDEKNYWPIRVLKMFARFPHEYRTWLWAMHTIPNGDPAEPFAENTSLSGVILLSPITTAKGFHELKISEEKTIHFHAIVPLYEDEMNMKLQKGAESLFDGFDEHGVSEILDISRKSIVPKKRGLFSFLKKI